MSGRESPWPPDQVDRNPKARKETLAAAESNVNSVLKALTDLGHERDQLEASRKVWVTKLQELHENADSKKRWQQAMEETFASIVESMSDSDLAKIGSDPKNVPNDSRRALDVILLLLHLPVSRLAYPSPLVAPTDTSKAALKAFEAAKAKRLVAEEQAKGTVPFLPSSFASFTQVTEAKALTRMLKEFDPEGITKETMELLLPYKEMRFASPPSGEPTAVVANANHDEDKGEDETSGDTDDDVSPIDCIGDLVKDRYILPGKKPSASFLALGTWLEAAFRFRKSLPFSQHRDDFQALVHEAEQQIFELDAKLAENRSSTDEQNKILHSRELDRFDELLSAMYESSVSSPIRHILPGIGDQTIYTEHED